MHLVKNNRWSFFSSKLCYGKGIWADFCLVVAVGTEVWMSSEKQQRVTEKGRFGFSIQFLSHCFQDLTRKTILNIKFFNCCFTLGHAHDFDMESSKNEFVKTTTYHNSDNIFMQKVVIGLQRKIELQQKCPIVATCFNTFSDFFHKKSEVLLLFSKDAIEKELEKNIGYCGYTTEPRYRSI